MLIQNEINDRSASCPMPVLFSDACLNTSFSSHYSMQIAEEKQLPMLYYPASNEEITIFDPQLKSNTFTKHVLYSISGIDSIGSFSNFRRFKEFIALRKVLTNQWPGCCVPTLPPKRAIVLFN